MAPRVRKVWRPRPGQKLEDSSVQHSGPKELDMVKVLPAECVESILLPLPPSRLQQLRSVSRSWNAFIASPNFKQRYFAANSDTWWLVMSGENAAYNVGNNSWCSFSTKVFELELGKWKTERSEEERYLSDAEEEDEDCFWENIMNLTWSRDGALTCCMDCPMEESDYDSDDPKQLGVRLVIFNNTTLSYNQVDNFWKCWQPIGVGIQSKPDGKEYSLVMVMNVEDLSGSSLFVSTYDSIMNEPKSGVELNISKVTNVYCSNFILEGCFYFLLEYPKMLGFSALYYRLDSNSWYYWNTNLPSQFFSQVSIETNMLKCGGRILAVGGDKKQLVVVELNKPLEGEGSAASGRSCQVIASPKHHQHKPGTWNKIATMPKTMLTELKKSSKSIRAFGNDYFIFVLPKKKLKAGQKGVTYNLESCRWQWMAPFPETCKERKDLHWRQLLGDTSIMVHHPKYSLFGSYSDYEDAYSSDDWKYGGFVGYGGFGFDGLASDAFSDESDY